MNREMMLDELKMGKSGEYVKPTEFQELLEKGLIDCEHSDKGRTRWGRRTDDSEELVWTE
ncbi:MAG: hypothetical protein KGI50_02405 [Patescibacteria group bacterium]|nr:hypothetical protein [Patescibacteria group bacterium]MDE2437802.1 hypothetical protein [Patescibacteria group bacterium]